ncbi:MAG: PEP/pyruvate-binding domain-containing protein [Bacteroidota bacterium]
MKTATQEHIITSQDLETKAPIGGKASNLQELGKLGIQVPNWVAIPADILLEQLPESDDIKELKVYFESLILPNNLLEEIARFFSENHQNKTYAIRSSALDEDGSQFSFAGQFETFLHVGFEELEEKIKAIWQSVLSDRVLKYRAKNGLELQLGIGVIVQEMVDAEVAGVAFGIDPISGEEGSKVVSAVYGLGEGLVSGELDADTFKIHSQGIEKQIVEKKYAFVRSATRKGVEKVKVASEKQNQATLNDEQLHQICELLDCLNTHFGQPQDIEFAFANNELYLLQTRPITAIAKPKGEYTLWDNSNIIESYPSITTPLTFSFILKMYEQVYRQFVGLMGVKKREIEQHKSVFANTLGLIRGRVYYNLLNWYKMLAMLPGYSINAEFMENMMGVKERFELTEDYRMSKGLAWFRIVKMLFNMIQRQIQLPRARKRFLTHLNSVMNEYKAIDFESLSPKEIIAHYQRFETTLLLEWKAPLINDFFAMIWFGMLQKQTEKYAPDAPNIHNDLLCGSQDIISVEPIHRSIAIARLVQEDEGAKELFEGEVAGVIWQVLLNGEFPEIKEAIDEYIDRFGERCVGELKLETISYSQAPELFVKIIKSYVEQGVTQQKAHSNIENDLRTKAEDQIFNQLKNKPLQRWWFKFILRQARDLVSNRENLRYERTRGFGMVRRMFSALGKQLPQLAHPRDIFYLELAEIKSIAKQDFQEELLEKIEARKAEFAAYKTQNPPQERFFTYGNNFSDEYIYSTEKLETIEGDLKGIGCCPGKVKGKVRIVHNPNEIDSLNGDILVTSSTDPGWVTLFPTAAAIIVERGSLLSHSAIVSREMGIPCIVSVTGLSRTLKTGDEVWMNGSTGEIKLI